MVADVLLCHDDELEGRRIAFILYLVPPWAKSDGGTLDLYSTDGKSGELSHGWLKKDTAPVPPVGTPSWGSTAGIKGFSLVRRNRHAGGIRTLKTGCRCRSWQTTLLRDRREKGDAVERGSLSLSFLLIVGAGRKRCRCARNAGVMEITPLATAGVRRFLTAAVLQLPHHSQWREVGEKWQFPVSSSSHFNQSVFSSSTEHGEPQQIAKSLVPSWNTLVFFEVSPVSFHQARSCLSLIPCCACSPRGLLQPPGGDGEGKGSRSVGREDTPAAICLLQAGLRGHQTGQERTKPAFNCQPSFIALWEEKLPFPFCVAILASCCWEVAVGTGEAFVGLLVLNWLPFFTWMP